MVAELCVMHMLTPSACSSFLFTYLSCLWFKGSSGSACLACASKEVDTLLKPDAARVEICCSLGYDKVTATSVQCVILYVTFLCDNVLLWIGVAQFDMRLNFAWCDVSEVSLVTDTLLLSHMQCTARSIFTILNVWSFALKSERINFLAKCSYKSACIWFYFAALFHLLLWLGVPQELWLPERIASPVWQVIAQKSVDCEMQKTNTSSKYSEMLIRLVTWVASQDMQTHNICNKAWVDLAEVEQLRHLRYYVSSLFTCYAAAHEFRHHF